MTYETCKALKDAGFPQHLEKKGRESLFGVATLSGGAEDCYYPTLEELIEAVMTDKTHYFGLDANDEWAVYDDPVKNTWVARYYPNTPVGFVSKNGSTPSEAVANLYLALNTH